MAEPRVIERVQRTAALGVRFWDAAEATSLIDGLHVEVFSRANPRARVVAQPNRSGIYVAHAVPGLRRFELGDVDADALSPAALGAYRVEVTDPSRRFLPLAFDADLPVRGLFTWRAPWLSPPREIVLPGEPGAPPPALIERVPLFSAPTRPVPDPLAVVYAQLRALGTERELAWTLLAVEIDGATRGLGMSDEHGRIAVMFPYPEPPRRMLASPPEARNDFTWQVALRAFVPTTASPPDAVPAFPDLAAALEALDTPRTVVESTVSPAAPLRLAYRHPLTVRTAGAVGEDAPYLFVSV